jgi:hypothetical protein
MNNIHKNSKNLKKHIKINNLKNLKKHIKKYCKKSLSFPSRLPPVKRIIVIGDLHGDWEATIKSLQIAKLIDINNNWIGKDTVVVQLGDQIDRCRNFPCDKPGSTIDDEASDIKILLYFTELHSMAQKVGGAVYSIIGNHELMNVQGDMRYVSYENINEFNDYYNKPNMKSGMKSDIKSDMKSGMESRIMAFKPGNPLANFLACTRKMVLIIGTNLFVHGGIMPEIANKYTVEEMNTKLSLYLQNKLDENIKNDETDILFNDINKSPLWTREFGVSTQSNIKCNELMSILKKKYNVERIFVGHTPQIDKGISSICDGAIWQVDYGASKAFDTFNSSKVYQVLEIIDDGIHIKPLKF